jgi:hypothetical protein
LCSELSINSIGGITDLKVYNDGVVLDSWSWFATIRLSVFGEWYLEQYGKMKIYFLM